MAHKRRRRRQEIPEEERFHTVRVESLVSGGRAIARLDDGRVVMVAFAAPGELVDIEVERIHKDYLEAVVREVKEPSPDRIEPECKLFGDCGGCQLQHMTYESQLLAKAEIVREQLTRIGHFEDTSVVREMVGAEDPWGYRNHVRFSTGRRYGDLGFVHRRGRGLLTVHECPIADPWVNETIPQFQRRCGGLHQLQMRRNPITNSTLIAPEVPGFEEETGQTTYIEELGGHEFRVSASSFFQVNNAQAERMVELVGAALPDEGLLLVDAFAGVGTFAIIFAERFENVLAIEESNSAIRDAQVNAAETPNVELKEGKVEHVLPLLSITPDAILLDPPRAGCMPDVLEAIIKFRPTSVVYVSCNPSTLARDLRVLVDGGYQLDSVTPLDMFPQTGHIECVTKLTLADAGLLEAEAVAAAVVEELDAELEAEPDEEGEAEAVA